jgi:hypothetical protein
VTDPNLVTSLVLGFRRDDGVVIYINGTKVHHDSNLPDPTTYLSDTTNIIDGTAEFALNTVGVAPSVLVAGTNVVAVELHQRDGSSSDITFALTLDGVVAAAAPPDAVVPEAPFAVLLPLGAGLAGIGAYAALRRRGRPAPAR